jgi:uncharacterized membrane protein
MMKTLFSRIQSILKPMLKPLMIGLMVALLVFSQADAALAARSGGRIGGGSFRAPSRTFSSPSRSYRAPSGGYYPGGGGFGFPFLIPLFGFGGGFGGLFTIILFISIANFLVRSFRNASEGDSLGYETAPSTVSVSQLQVGLLAEARSLQDDLNRIAGSADTSSAEGLTQVLQETSLALLRHPEYWVYAGSASQQTRLEAAEAQFNRLALTERSKFSEETLTNVKNQIRQAPSIIEVTPDGDGQLVPNSNQGPGEYIVVTIIVASLGKLQLSDVKSTDDLRRALSQLGSVSNEQMLALEVLWAPQAEGDTLSADDMMAAYPDLKLI